MDLQGDVLPTNCTFSYESDCTNSYESANSYKTRTLSSDILQKSLQTSLQNDVPWSSWRSGCAESVAPQRAGSSHQSLCGFEETIPYCD